MNKSPLIPLPDWNHELVSAWLAFAAASDCQKNLNRLGEALDSTLRICRPTGSYGALREHADEIRQNAHILLLHGEGVFSHRQRRKPRQGYLAGNERLREATARGDRPEINRQLLRSTLAVLNHCGQRMRRRLSRERHRLLRLEDVLEEQLGVCRHPSELEPAELAPDARGDCIVEALREPASRSHFPKETLELAARVFTGLCGASEAARELGVTPSAVSQRLKPVREWLVRQRPRLEVPLS